jgi:hypothetical protein
MCIGVVFQGSRFRRLEVKGGFLLSTVRSAECSPCRTPRPCCEAGGDAQGSQESQPGLAPYRQRRIFHAAVGGYNHPIGSQAQGSRFPPRKLSCQSSQRRSCSQVQEFVGGLIPGAAVQDGCCIYTPREDLAISTVRCHRHYKRFEDEDRASIRSCRDKRDRTPFDSCRSKLLYVLRQFAASSDR